jgi:hypothetical protein
MRLRLKGGRHSHAPGAEVRANAVFCPTGTYHDASSQT